MFVWDLFINNSYLNSFKFKKTIKIIKRISGNSKGEKMKKIILILLLSLILVSPVIANDLPDGVYNATSLQIHMRQNFYYGYDRVLPDYFEYFQSPSILEFSKIGDCDDFATYSWYYLKVMHYDVQRYTLILKDGEEIVGHAVTVFYDIIENGYSVFSNQYLFKTLKDNPVDAIKDIYPTWQIIFKWTPSKLGYLTATEVYNDFEPVAFVDLKTAILYYYGKTKLKVLDYVDN